MIVFFETESKTNLDAIRDVESIAKMKFSDEYIEHILKYNGGRCEPNVFSFLGNEGKTQSRVNWFLAIYAGEFDSLFDYINDFKVEEKRIPNSFLPIANDPFGNLICQDCDNGSIYFWDHENEVDYSTYSDKNRFNIYFISNSLSEFLSSLKLE